MPANNDLRRAPVSSPAAQPLALLALGHAALFCIALSWGFGGNALSLRPWLFGFGSLASLPPLLLLCKPALAPHPRARSHLLGLLPLLLLEALGLIGLFNPSFQAYEAWGQLLLRPLQAQSWMPSCAQPRETLWALWITHCLVTTGFNVLIFGYKASHLRRLVLGLACNAALLATLGALQELSGAKGLYFGLVRSSNPTFFATFIYHNHWGSFAVLWLCAALGLIARQLHRPSSRYRDFWHSPGSLLLLAALVIALTPALAGSRSTTVLTALILCGATFAWLRIQTDAKSRTHPHPPPPAQRRLRLWLGATLALGSVLLGMLWLAAPSLRPRLLDTMEQVQTIRQEGNLGARPVLYRDTLRLFADKPLFGWGKGSYKTAFQSYNSQSSSKVDRLPIVYADAHSDWLQCLAELGLLGGLLTVLCAAIPLWQARLSYIWQSHLSRWLLAGCALILLYAGVEFPFGNPAVTLSWWLCLLTALRHPHAD